MSLQNTFGSLSTPAKATVLMVLAMLFFTSMGIFIRLSAEQLHSFGVVFFRNALALLLLTPWIVRRGPGVLHTRRLGLYTLRSALNVVGMLAGFTALTLIPLAEATALGFSAPLFATLGAALVLGETIRARRITALAVGFVGMIVILRPGLEPLSLGSALALLNAFLLAMTALVVKKLTATERPEAIVVWMVLLQTPLSLLPALAVWEWPNLATWFWLWCLAGAGTLGHICWTRACALAEITQLQPMEFIKLPLAALFAYLVFAEQPTLWTWLGGGIIFASTAYITHREVSLARRRLAADGGRRAGEA